MKFLKPCRFVFGRLFFPWWGWGESPLAGSPPKKLQQQLDQDWAGQKPGAGHSIQVSHMSNPPGSMVTESWSQKSQPRFKPRLSGRGHRGTFTFRLAMEVWGTGLSYATLYLGRKKSTVVKARRLFQNKATDPSIQMWVGHFRRKDSPIRP